MASRNKQFLTMFWVWRTLSNTCTLNMFHKPFGEMMLLKKFGSVEQLKEHWRA